MKNDSDKRPEKGDESLNDIKTVEDLYAKYFPDAYNRKLEEKSFESYTVHTQPVKASCL